MKNINKLKLVFIMLVGFITIGSTQSISAKDITGQLKISEIFKDEETANKVTASLSKSGVDDLVTQADLNQITELTIYGPTELTGLEYLNNIAKLFIIEPRTADFSSISTLTNLKYLILDTTPSNVTNLDNVPVNVEDLRLTDTNISDISNLSNFKMLKSFTVYNSKIKDISALKHVESLERFDYMTTDSESAVISDISPLKELSNLKNIHLFGQAIYDLSPFKNHFSSLESLIIPNNIVNTEPVYVNDTVFTDKNFLIDYDGKPMFIDAEDSYNSSRTHKLTYDEDSNALTWNDLEENTNLSYIVRSKFNHNGRNFNYNTYVNIPVFRTNKLTSNKK